MGGRRQTPGPLLRQTPGPVSDSSVRQKADSAHGVPAGAVPCVRRPDPLTASPPELSRASEGRIRARHLRRTNPHAYSYVFPETEFHRKLFRLFLLANLSADSWPKAVVVADNSLIMRWKSICLVLKS